MSAARRMAWLLAALALVVAACGDDNGTAVEDGSTTTMITRETDPDGTVATTAPPETASPDTTPTTFPPGGGVDLSLTRDDVDCAEYEEFTGEEFDYHVVHYVVEGNLGAVCFGEEDDTLYQAWDLLTTIVPGGQLNDLALFVGYVSLDEEAVTLAYVSAFPELGVFEMAVDLDQADADADEFALTMAHEFSHVFTALPFELDRDVDEEDCTTYFNGDGCYTEASLMWEWVRTFWDAELLAEIDPFDQAFNEEGAVQRCATDAGFIGEYAATTPEEDFAEAFSAFVFQVPVEEPAVQARMDWFAQQPGLLEFQERAEAAGLADLAGNNFTGCGF